MKLIFKILLSTIILYPSDINAKSDIEIAGDYLQLLIPAYGVYLGVKNNDIDGLKQFGQSMLYATISTQVLKHTVQRKRPDGSDTKSFPSGHTSAAFSGASYIHSRYKNLTQSVIAYTLASFVGYSRVYANKHHISDVIAGALISYGFDRYLVDKDFKINTIISDNKNALYIHWKI